MAFDIPSTNVTYMYDDDILNPNKDIEKLQDDDDEELINNIISKTNKQSLNRGWNDNNETLIISIGENAASYKYMHERSGYICNTIHNVFKISLIVCSTFLTVLTTTPQENMAHSVIILRYIFTYVVTLLSVLLHFLQYAYMSERHNQAAAQFGMIYHDIQQQMCLYRRDRYIAFKYLSKILKKYDSLIMISPKINPYVMRQFKKTFKNSETSIPEIAKKIQKIDIISEMNTSQSGSGSGSNISVNGENDKSFQVNSRSIPMVNVNSFMINGDITDNDIECCKPQNIKKLRERFFKENATYEYMRFLHNENDF